MYYALISVHLFLCLVMIGLVLLQQGKGADMGATLGGGSNTLFGAAGANQIVLRITTITAVLFMVTSVLLMKQYQLPTVAVEHSSTLEGSVVSGELQQQAAPKAEAPSTEPQSVPEAVATGATTNAVQDPAALPSVQEQAAQQPSSTDSAPAATGGESKESEKKE